MSGDMVLIQLPGIGTLKLARDAYEAALQSAERPDTPASQPCEDLVTAKQLAIRLNLPVSCVYEYAKTGRIPCIRMGRHVGFNLGSVLLNLQSASGRNPRNG
jgi:excisionase family DNA binding protein